MLEGRFGNTSGRPYLEGRVYLPRLDIWGEVSFLADTGADASLLHPGDGHRLDIDYRHLQGTGESFGVGGAQENFLEPALLVFTDPGTALYGYSIELAIAKPNPTNIG